MQLYNLKHPEQKVSFKEASVQGLGKDRGLFFPSQIPTIDNLEHLLSVDFLTRCELVISAWVGDEFEAETIKKMVKQAFIFDAPLVPVSNSKMSEGLDVMSLELFHGPTLAFKDFGARFMAQVLGAIAQDNPMTILTATSGDTGAAVADAFYQIDNINVVVLYPDGKISEPQKRLFTTLGQNISAIAVKSDFDACQRLVKLAFQDKEVTKTLGLNSANSINISRLLAQVCYYFEAVAQYVKRQPSDFKLTEQTAPTFSVPSGNFGNLTAGLFAKAMGLPIKQFIAATNSNDTVPRFLNDKTWHINPTVATMSNAMDVSNPSNWPRVEAIFSAMDWSISDLVGIAVTEEETQQALSELQSLGYTAEPHAAVAYHAIKVASEKATLGNVQSLNGEELKQSFVFLATAHPAKFKDVVEEVLKTPITMPEKLRLAMELDSHSEFCDDDFPALKTLLLSH